MIFRDREGNFYSLSEEVLSKHIIDGELPENVELVGSQPDSTSYQETAASYNYTASAADSAASYNYSAADSAASYNYSAPAMAA